MMMKLFLILLAIGFSNLNAAEFRSGSLTYLNGSNYKVKPEKQQTVTFEYVTMWNWGDVFMFVDSTSFDSAGSSYYGEISPRIKVVELGEQSLFSKVFIATTFERGENGSKSNLYGIGFNLNVSSFKYLTANIYQRDNLHIPKKGYQLTSTFGYKTSIGDLPLLIDGYIDWTFSSNETAENFHFNPQVKIDMKQWLHTKQQWYLGIEYDYWQNKYGIEDSVQDDSNQNTFSLLAKWHF